MCTVTLIARRNGYVLGMNRDEKLARPLGLSPQKMVANGRAILAPSEPGGGTWIAVNDHGITIALINWYSVASPARRNPLSRGAVVVSVASVLSSDDLDSALRDMPLARVNPFRLIGVFPTRNEVVEWQWNTKQLLRHESQWKSQQWISSGFDEPVAQRIRGQTFDRARRQLSAGSLKWLRRLHRSHKPGSGPFSICMHRADAATVSYTEISFSSHKILMKYSAGPPCQTKGFIAATMPLAHAKMASTKWKKQA